MARKIQLHEMDDVQELVTAANRCDFDIDVFYDRVIVDAKSYLGLLGMGFNRDLMVRCHGENTDFERTLQKFAVG